MTTQPTNSIDSKLEEIVEGLIEIARGWVEDQLSGTSYFKEALDGLEARKSEALQAIKALYRKEIEEAIPKKIPTESHYANVDWENGFNQAIEKLRAKLLPPTKGGNDE